MLILASSSPRRQDLLRTRGYAFIRCEVAIPETFPEGDLSVGRRQAYRVAESLGMRRAFRGVAGSESTVIGLPEEIAVPMLEDFLQRHN